MSMFIDAILPIKSNLINLGQKDMSSLFQLHAIFCYFDTISFRENNFSDVVLCTKTLKNYLRKFIIIHTKMCSK